MKIRVALVGYGYWGPNLLRNMQATGLFDIVGVAEMSADRRKQCAGAYPGVPVYEKVDEMLRKAAPAAVAIATPPPTHRDIALTCLRSGADILVEKPLALSSDDANAILRLAKQLRRKVMVDHTFTYHPAVQYLASLVHSGGLGDLLYYDSVRINLGKIQSATNVLWDLGPHDLSILDFLSKGRTPQSVSAVGATPFSAGSESIAYVHLTYADGFIAHLHLNWIAPVKLRTVLVGGSKKMAIYDDMLPSEKLRIYDRGVDLKVDPMEQRISYRIGDMMAPALSSQESLANVVRGFAEYVTKGKEPALTADGALRIVKTLEAADQSMKAGGQPVKVALEEEAEKAA